MDKHWEKSRIDEESFHRIVDWLDLNAQYYGDYSHNRLERQSPKGDGEKALRAHIASTFGEQLAKLMEDEWQW